MFHPIIGFIAIALAVVFYAFTIYHIVLILLGLRLSRRRPTSFDKGSLRNPVDLPAVSVIIPAKDEEALIEGAVRNAEALDYPAELLQIIVVTDGSTDGTVRIGERLESQIENLIFLNGHASTGKPAALNRGLRVAKGELIAFFDVDTRYAPDLLLRVAKFLHDHAKTEVVQAVPKVADAESNVITRLNAYEYLYWFEGLHAAKDKYGLFMHLAGAGMFVRHDVFERIGLWDEECVAEDLEFAWRYTKDGGRAALLPAEVQIQPAYSSGSLFRQRRRWWAGTLQVLWKRLRTGLNPKLTWRVRADTAIYLVSPIVLLVSSIFFLTSIGFVTATGNVSTIFAAWIFGFLGTNLLLLPLIVIESVLQRDPRLLFLIPGLYWYWVIQVSALGVALVSLATRRRIEWEKTPKRPMKGDLSGV